jgi:hypothetical protein
VGTDLGLSLKLPIPRNSGEIVCAKHRGDPPLPGVYGRCFDAGQHGVRFVEMAGNSEITLSVLAPQSWHYDGSVARQLFSMPVLTRPGRQRVVLTCGVPSLDQSLRALHSDGVVVEHVL